MLRFSGAFSGDPEVLQKIANTLAASKTTYERLRPRLERAGAPPLVQLEELLVASATPGRPDEVGV